MTQKVMATSRNDR